MSIPIISLTLFATVCTAVAQLFFKSHMEKGGGVALSKLLRSSRAMSGVALYLLYLGALILAYRLGGEISVVFPLTAVAYLLTPAFGWVILKERFGWRVPVGACLIIMGCILVASPL